MEVSTMVAETTSVWAIWASYGGTEDWLYNYRMSCCQRVCENAFGILANRYACLLNVIRFQPKIATNIILTAICWINLMHMRYPAIQNAAMDREDDNNVIPGKWRRGNIWEQELHNIHGNRDTNSWGSTWSITTTLQPEQSHDNMTWYRERTQCIRPFLGHTNSPEMSCTTQAVRYQPTFLHLLFE